jgi:catechol 2,3-dioxygenase-like lactoylglutathione lyase family enzyme
MCSVRIHHLAMRTRDVERLERFYAGLLGLAVLRRDEERKSVWLDASGAILMLEPASATEPAVPDGSGDLVAFAVDDKERWRRTLEGARVPVEAETAYTLYFRDPDGRRVAVSTYGRDAWGT